MSCQAYLIIFWTFEGLDAVTEIEYKNLSWMIEKSVPRIIYWNNKACRMMTNSDPEGLIFLSHTHTSNRFFFLLATKYFFLYWKNMKKISRTSWMRWDVTWGHNFNNTMTPRTNMQLFFFFFPTGWYGYYIAIRSLYRCGMLCPGLL